MVTTRGSSLGGYATCQHRRAPQAQVGMSGGGEQTPQRVARSRHFMNVKRVRELPREPDGGGTMVLTDGVRLRVARGRWEAMERAQEMEEF